MFRAIVRSWDLYLAVTVLYLAIAIALGPEFFFAAFFIGGCLSIIAIALKR